jgi:hypothetical protein
VEHLAHVDSVSGELGARAVEVVDHEERSLNRSRRGGRKPFAEHHRARRSGRCHLHQTPVLVGEVRVQPPAEAPIEALGAIDVGHRDDDDFEFQIGV